MLFLLARRAFAINISSPHIHEAQMASTDFEFATNTKEVTILIHRSFSWTMKIFSRDIVEIPHLSIDSVDQNQRFRVGSAREHDRAPSSTSCGSNCGCPR